jgi:hypothetical protein
MWAFISLLPDWVKLPAAGLLGALVVSPGVFLYGKHEGRQAAALAAAQAISKAYKDRNDENASVEALDSVSLCVELGGMLSDCRASLRGMAEDHGPASDGGLSGGQ